MWLGESETNRANISKSTTFDFSNFSELRLKDMHAAEGAHETLTYHDAMQRCLSLGITSQMVRSEAVLGIVPNAGLLPSIPVH